MLPSEATIGDLMMLTRNIKHDVIELIKMKGRHPLNAVYETGEVFLGTCDSREVGGIGVPVNASIIKNVDTFEQLTTRTERPRMRRCDPTQTLTIFFAYASTSSYEEEEVLVEALYMDLRKLYREDHTFYKIIVGDFNAEIDRRRTSEKRYIVTHDLRWN
ncbi:hypothetical protein RB195_025683 [Necator americanus]|uniref:Endonuclease/exonuclease/phosphatase domain-containing protein n=1 Tax=Necator americanus TaxID=51031 RepID=A0ABR1ETE9_NECAM